MRTEDGYVISKCLNGEPEAFGFLMDKYKGSVYAFAYSKLRNFHDAEDVTQEVFIKAYGKLRSLRRWDNFLAWLYAITSNMCKNWIRFKANRPDSEFVEDQSAEVLMQPSLSSYREDRINETLREALDSLPETQRQVLTLHYLGGMNGKEIARFLGISPGAVWERLSRARAQLREEMLEMMSTTFEAQKLQAGFTMRMVEIVKRIKIHPMLRMAGLPWGMSLAAGIIIGVLSVGTHLSLTNTEPYASVSSLSGESRALDIGELPVDVMKMSDMAITSDQHLPGNGSGNVVPDVENALFMAPQAEGGTWARKADMPTARQFLSTSEVNGKIYAIGGVDQKPK
jgi:RNA polymerase sigma factor (sigma-70 family)